LNQIRFRLHTGQSMKTTMAGYLNLRISKTAASLKRHFHAAQHL
jgi:hypothetical protein